MFAERLKLLRKSKPNLTQQDMANILGVAKTTYASYEQGKRTPDAELQNKIADYFGVTLDYLHGRNHTPEWANHEEVMELDKILKSNTGMTYGPDVMTDEDREQIDDLIASYFWLKKQKEARKKDGK
ncbi:helix-turn-helix transcriptional regulator [Enterococcus faecalis]|uniref:helix-turn-helix domain-containing protein n=1 Tax=Enterococcus faecalis TaxID=1351 RepID=UPI0011DD66BD|nr:helix-turn-helix transcriptional regulator [Enterococcus faecalis]TXW51163.1 XRE family transcriptional regulator [Enterococcus faecalis]